MQPECVAKKRCGDGELQKLEPKRKQLDADGRTQARLPKKAAKDTPAIRQYTVTLGYLRASSARLMPDIST